MCTAYVKDWQLFLQQNSSNSTTVMVSEVTHSSYWKLSAPKMFASKGKQEYLYSAILVRTHTLKALRHGSHSFTCKQRHVCLSFVSVHQMALPLTEAADTELQLTVLFCSLGLAFLDPRVGHTMDVLSPFISILCHSDWLFHRESCPRLDVVYPGRAWSSSPACTWHRSLHYFFLQAIPLFPRGVTIVGLSLSIFV